MRKFATMHPGRPDSEQPPLGRCDPGSCVVVTPLAALLPAWHAALGGACMTGPELVAAASFDGPLALALRETLRPFGGGRAGALGRMLARYAGQRAAGFRLEMFRKPGEGNRVVFQVLPDDGGSGFAVSTGETAGRPKQRNRGASRGNRGESSDVQSETDQHESISVQLYRILPRII